MQEITQFRTACVSSVDGPSEYLNYCNFWGYREGFPFCGRRGIDSLGSCAPRPPRVFLTLFPPFLVFACSTYIRETLRSRCYVHRSRTDNTCIRHMYLHKRISTYFAALLRTEEKFIRASVSACFRRSELLGCMTLPLPLSQDKVNITKLRVYIRNVRSRDIRSQFTSSTPYIEKYI